MFDISPLCEFWGTALFVLAFIGLLVGIMAGRYVNPNA